MLENGMSLVALSLPSLWLLCTSVIPEKVARSLHSVLSLSWMFSGRSSGSSTERSNAEKAISRDKRLYDLKISSGLSDDSVPTTRNDLESHSSETYANV